MKNQERMYKPTEVAVLMNLSALRIRRMCQEGKFTNVVKTDGQWLIPQSAIKLELERRINKTASLNDIVKAL